MDSPGRVVHPLLVIALVLVAVAGYLAGSRHSTAHAAGEDPPSQARVLSSSGLLLEYPVDWQRAAAPTSIPGLTLTGPVTLAPQGATAAGMLSGQLPAGEPGPLPASFLAQLHGLPHVEVVDLVSTQAYRYSSLGVPGFSGALDLYVIPSEGGGARVMACFAPQQLTPAGQQCERIVSGVALTGAPTATLTPEPIYAKALSAVVASLDSERARTRQEMSSSDSAADVAASASSLASRLSSAAASLASLQAPPLAAPAGVALAEALHRAGQSYSALAVAARSESLSEYETARSAIGSAEAQVDAALANFTLLGYGPS